MEYHKLCVLKEIINSNNRIMKIALLICGTIRNYKENYLSWKKHLLNLFNVTIFFHTYDIDGYHSKNNIPLSQTDTNILIKTINPKKYLIESYSIKMQDFTNQIKCQCLRRGSANPESIKSQLYSIYMVNLLKKIDEKENNYKYDIVIKIRFDTIFYNDFNILDINMIKKFNDVILCGNPDIKTMLYKNACLSCIDNYKKNIFNKCDKHTDISDIVIMSNSKNMDYYANIYFTYDVLIMENHNKIKLMYPPHILNQYISFIYDNGAIMYTGVPKITCLYPESALSLHLKNFALLNYTIKVDTNRNII